MLENPIIKAMLNRKSIRKFTDRVPSDEAIETIVRAGQQAPFAAQMCSLILSRDRENIPYKAPISFLFCIDSHRFEKVMAKRGWKLITNDLFLLLMGIQDAALMGGNMVMAAVSFGMGSCYIGKIPYLADSLANKYRLPPRIFPLVELVMGYPDESPPPRPRYPMDFVLFENEYPEFSDDQIERAMKVMDDGYLAQDYYRSGNQMLKLPAGREETFTYDNYSWTEHISRRWGQWYESLEKLKELFARRGFKI